MNESKNRVKVFCSFLACLRDKVNALAVISGCFPADQSLKTGNLQSFMLIDSYLNFVSCSSPEERVNPRIQEEVPLNVVEPMGASHSFSSC